ncbi:MAG TPA: PAS domain-containing protein [Trinickia sp.]|uniref:PAS domain-containing protein n=1 Tax=Trinickia sp. TaxID=2571163 RepID=UPI002CE5B4D0|nr:PAS domain-containing protein [Trinickia sp.]HVW50435.1 PAS domain-containing protein [Trinickia sp.]
MKNASHESLNDVQALRRENEALREALHGLERQLAQRDERVVSKHDALLETAHCFDLFFEHSGDLLFLLEAAPNGRLRFLRVNPLCAQLFGAQANELAGAFIDETAPGDLADFIYAAACRCMALRAKCEDERTIALADRRCDLRAAMLPLCDASGQVRRILGMAHDVTVDKRTVSFEAIRHELEGQFRSLAESSSDIICRYDRACRLVYANSGLLTLMRRPLQDLLGKTPNEHEPDLRLAQYQALLHEAIETGIQRDIELLLPDTGNGVRYHHIRIFPERTLHGETIGVLALGRDVTERKLAEDRLHASEQAFRAVVEHSPDFIARYDLSYRRIYANPALRSLTTVDVVGKTPAELGAFVDPAHYMSRLRTVVETRQEVTEQVRLRDRNGRIRWGHIRIVPEFSPSGAVASVLAISRDIDDLKRSEQLFRTLTENFPDMIARFDASCRYLYVNPAVTKAFGIAQEAMVGSVLGTLQIDGSAELTASIRIGLERAFAEGVSNEAEAYWYCESGVRVFELRHIPEHDSEGQVVSVLGVARDITWLRAMETALRDSERAFRTLAENAPDPIIRYDHECRRIYVNPEFERVCGMDASELLGRKAGRVLSAPPAVERRFRDRLRAVMRTGIGAKFELNWETPAKPQCWSVQLVPEYDADGKVQSGLTIWRDISERKEVEQRLRESYDILRELTSRRETAREEERKRIARELHDELGQQLTALRMGASTLRIRFGPDNPALAEQVQKLLELADQTMQVVRNAVSSLRPGALDAGISAALEWLTAEFSRGTQIAYSLSVPDETLPLAEERAIALFRIVQESLTNVARHARARHVCVTLERVGDDCLLQVRDDGCGFDPVATRRRSFGLAGMKERMLMLGGKIDIVSAPGKGTTIKVELPIGQADGAAAACMAERA